MAGSMLRLLRYRFSAKRLNNWRDMFRLVPHNYNNLLGAQRLAGLHYVFDQRAAPGSVQHLCQAGFQPRPFSRCQDNNDQIVI